MDQPVPFTDLGGHAFYFERHGSGTPLLFLGGTGGDLRRPETRFWGPLARHFDLLAFDQRGMGQSWKGDAPFTMADYADDAAALLAAQGWTAPMSWACRSAAWWPRNWRCGTPRGWTG